MVQFNSHEKNHTVNPKTDDVDVIIHKDNQERKSGRMIEIYIEIKREGLAKKEMGVWC